MERTNYGFDGGAHPIYSALRSFEMTFDLGSPSDVKEFIDIYNSVSATGSFVACLPKWGDPDYIFYNYSGTTVQEPSVGAYFQGFIQSVKLLLIGIRTQ